MNQLIKYLLYTLSMYTPDWLHLPAYPPVSVCVSTCACTCLSAYIPLHPPTYPPTHLCTHHRRWVCIRTRIKTECVKLMKRPKQTAALGIPGWTSMGLQCIGTQTKARWSSRTTSRGRFRSGPLTPAAM